MNYKQALKNAKNENFSDKSVQDLFHAEIIEEDTMYSEMKYKGMNEEEKQKVQQYEYDEMQACNEVYDYYN
jgi:hypothetical protein